MPVSLAGALRSRKELPVVLSVRIHGVKAEPRSFLARLVLFRINETLIKRYSRPEYASRAFRRSDHPTGYYPVEDEHSRIYVANTAFVIPVKTRLE